MRSKLKIGLSACYFPPDLDRKLFTGKPLLYMEQNMANMILRHGALAYLLPAPHAPISAEDLMEEMDGLLLQGGTDIAPQSYGQVPIEDGRWPGDPTRDAFEIEIFNATRRLKKPILGICRGHQLINVALGGSLFQDIQTQNDTALLHRNAEIYDGLHHDLQIQAGSLLSKIYDNRTRARINSIHHQAIDTLAPDLIVEASAQDDGIIEAIRLPVSEFVYGVQWHPEFQSPGDPNLLNPDPLIKYFLAECLKNRNKM